MLIVISGGSQGLGYAIGKIWAERGAEVVLVARTKSKLRDAVDKLGKNARYIVGDVADAAQCDRIFAEVGAIPDKVFCCAGAARPGFFLELSGAELESAHRTVYNTALFFSHSALQVLASAPDKLNNRRQLIFCSSTLAVFPFIGYSSYAPGKAAIRALADIVRQEGLEHNVRVSHILPGSMATEGYEIEEQTKPAVTKRIEGPSAPLDAEDVAKTVISALDRGQDTVYTDTVTWVLGSMMMGTSPRGGPLGGLLQSLVGLFLVLFGWVVRWSINSDIRAAIKEDPLQAKRSS